jgi:WD40 repeat protein
VTPPRYWAFISYSHRDKARAEWLHRALESYRVPRSLVGRPGVGGEPIPRRLFPIFRDHDELPGSADLGATLRSALATSRNLIVIASPEAAASKWVDSEVRAFQEGGRGDRIFCVLVGGTATGSATPAECIPPSCKRTNGVEPLAVDARDARGGGRRALLGVVAAILGVGLDTLIRRQRLRTQRAILATVAFTASAAGAIWGVTVWRTQARMREAERLVEQSAKEAQKRVDAERKSGVEKVDVERRASQAAALERAAYDAILRGQFPMAVAKLRECWRFETPGAARQLLMGWAIARARKRSSIYFGTELQGYRSGNLAFASFSHDGSIVAAIDDNGRGFLHSSQTGKRLRELVNSTSGSLRKPTFSFDDKDLFLGAQFGPARSFRVDTGASTGEYSVPSGPSVVIGEHVMLIASPTEDRIVSASEQAGGAILWEAKQGRPVSKVEANGKALRAVSFSSDGGRWALADDGGKISVYRAKDGAVVTSLQSSEKRIELMRFVPKQDRLVVLAFGHLSVWDLTTGRSSPLAGFDGVVEDLDVSRDGRWLVAAGADGFGWLWNLGTSAPPRSLQVVLTAADDNEPDLGPPIDVKSYRPDERVVMGMAKVRFSFDGNFVLGLHTRGKFCVWAVSTGLPLLCIDGPRGRRLGLEIPSEQFKALVWGEDISFGRPTLHEFPRETHDGAELERLLSGLAPPTGGPL